MKKITLLFIALGGIILSHAYTIVYECIDKKDATYVWQVNIDFESLHYQPSNSGPILFKYIDSRIKDKREIHWFKNSKYSFLLYQNPKNPMFFLLHDYEDEKLRYEYQCEYDFALKGNHKDSNKIPITFKAYNKKSVIKILEKASWKVSEADLQRSYSE